MDRVRYLDGLRGVAILAVVLFHAYSRWQMAEPYQQPQWLVELLSYGWLGVPLFFCISGYVIFMSLQRSSSLLVFGTLRFLRLAPAMWVASLFILATAGLISERPEGELQLIDLLPGLTFIQPFYFGEFFNLDVKSLDGAFWSLYVEVKFYAIAGLLFFVFKDKALLSLLAGYITYVVLSTLNPPGGILSFIETFLFHLSFEHYGWFLIGIFTYKLVAESSWVNVWALLFVVLCTLTQTLVLSGEFSVALMSGEIVVLLLFLLPIYNHTLARALACRFLLYFGFISYPLYLIHQNLITGLAIKLHAAGISLPALFYPAPFILLAILLATIMARSEPMLRQQVKRVLPAWLLR